MANGSEIVIPIAMPPDVDSWLASMGKKTFRSKRGYAAYLIMQAYCAANEKSNGDDVITAEDQQ